MRELVNGAILRAATERDLPEIHKLIAENAGTVLKRTDEEVMELFPNFWVIELETTIIGCCCLEIYSKKIAEVRTLAVKPEFRGRGYARALVREAIETANSNGIPQVLTVTSSPEFFEKLNFGPCLKEKYALFWNGKLD